MKTLTSINRRTSIVPTLRNSIINYLKQSFTIQKKFNIKKEEEFIKSLPTYFSSKLMKEINSGIYYDLIFFKNLTQNVVREFSIKLEKKLAHND